MCLVSARDERSFALCSNVVCFVILLFNTLNAVGGGSLGREVWPFRSKSGPVLSSRARSGVSA